MKAFGVLLAIVVAVSAGMLLQAIYEFIRSEEDDPRAR